MNRTDPKPLGLVVCMPTRGAVSIETMLCLREHLDGYPNKLLTAFRMPVVAARNQLAKEARELDGSALEFDPKYCLCVDDDAWWPAGLVRKAVGILEANPSFSVVSGLASPRKAQYSSTCYEDCEELKPYGYPTRYPDGLLTRLRLCSGHWLVMRRSILNLVGEEPFNEIQEPDGVWSEDYSFSQRVRDAGGVIVTENSLITGHVDVGTGTMYFPFAQAYQANGLAVPTQIDTNKHKSNVRQYFERQGGKDVWKCDVPTRRRIEGALLLTDLTATRRIRTLDALLMTEKP